MENNEQPKYPLAVSNEVALGKYANLAVITHSATDFIFDFAAGLPGFDMPQVCSRVVMSPANAKQLLFALSGNIQNFEKTFGEIKFPEPVNAPEPEGGRTIAPFGDGTKGQA